MVSTIITAVVTLAAALVGYLGGVQKGKADLHVEQERSRQLRDKWSQDHLQHRMATYHDALNAGTEAVAAMHRPVAGGIQLAAARLQEFENQIDGVLAYGVLHGTEWLGSEIWHHAGDIALITAVVALLPEEFGVVVTGAAIASIAAGVVSAAKNGPGGGVGGSSADGGTGSVGSGGASGSSGGWGGLGALALCL